MTLRKSIPGLIYCLILGVIAYFLGKVLPLGGVTIALLLGIAISNLVKLPEKVKPGIVYSEKKLLTLAIALLGFNLNYSLLQSLGLKFLIFILLGVVVTISLGLIWGRIFKLPKELSLLLGIGNAVCGSSAIATAQSVIHSDEENVGLSLATINLLGTIGIFILPLIASLIPHLDFSQKGLLIGNTLQAVGQVTAAGFTLGKETGDTATLVKMGRILLLTPLALILTIVFSGKNQSTTPRKGNILSFIKVPPYIIAFLIFSLANTFFQLPELLTKSTAFLSESLLIIAMSGIGSRISFKGIMQEGYQAFLTGLLIWCCQIGFSVFLITQFI
ncbi:YeiH family protein [Spirochaeta cellobiosiphila]|uniref:YeiH family protein n=1 Tax=Spirochaeta cellobiosiphila TaxID=504483 RepID=UPI0003FB145C|nr:putative sulfate exporter family transporter [Spirochaeta cellobiosiphila]